MGGRGYTAKYKSNVTEKQAHRIGLIGDDNIYNTAIHGSYERITYKKVIGGITYIFTRYEKRKETKTTSRKRK